MLSFLSRGARIDFSQHFFNSAIMSLGRVHFAGVGLLLLLFVVLGLPGRLDRRASMAGVGCGVGGGADGGLCDTGRRSCGNRSLSGIAP